MTKKQYSPLVTSLLISIIFPILVNDFFFRNFEIQFYNPNPMVMGIKAILVFVLLFAFMWLVYKMIDHVINRYKILAVFIAIINPLIALFIFILISINIQALLVLKLNPGAHAAMGRVIPIMLMIGLLGIQAIIEFQSMKKAWELIDHRRPTTR